MDADLGRKICKNNRVFGWRSEMGAPRSIGAIWFTAAD
jgi:hypothetical protein